MPGNIDFIRALHVRFCFVITLLRDQTKCRDCALENTRLVGRVTSHRPRDRVTRRARIGVIGRRASEAHARGTNPLADAWSFLFAFADGRALSTLAPPGDASELPLRQLRERARFPAEVLRLVSTGPVLRAAQDEDD